MIQAIEVFPGVFSIRLPLPFELSSVNVHLIRLEGHGFLMLDCGLDTEASFAALESGVRSIGIEWTDIRQILLTHSHPDHMGLSQKVLDLSGAQLFLHEIEARQLRLVRTPEQRAGWIGRAFTESGVPPPLQTKMHEHFLFLRKNFHDLVPDVLLIGGEQIPTGIGALRVIPTPGHAPGHVCLYSERHRLMISGDQMLPRITPNISWMPERDTLADYLGSLQGLKQFEIDLILPSHGQPFTGHHSWIEKTSRHHHERCDEIQELLDEPRTAHSLVSDLWSKPLSPINHQFALLEVLAHLEFMQRQGHIRSEQQAGVIQWFAERG